MAKKKKENMSEYAKDLVGGGMMLGLGAGVVESLPASAAKTGVQAGLGTAGSFFPTMATIGAAGIVTKQLKSLKKSTKRRR